MIQLVVGGSDVVEHFFHLFALDVYKRQGVYPSLRFCGRYALHAVHARFIFQCAVYIVCLLYTSLNWEKLYNMENNGYMQQLVTVEAEVFRRTCLLLDSWKMCIRDRIDCKRGRNHGLFLGKGTLVCEGNAGIL